MVNRKRKQESDEDEDGASDGSKKATTQKATTSKGKVETVKKPKVSEDDTVRILRNADGEKYIDLGKKKRAAVRSFKGMVFLDIREFYGADGDEKPGKKGISLSAEQWEALKRSMDTIDSLLAEHGKK